MKKKHEVSLLPKAEEDLLEIVDYISEDRPSAAEKLVDRIEKVFALLAGNPMLGRKVKESRLRLLQYRYLVVENYLVFYVFRSERVVVCRILHGAREYLSIL